MLGKYFFLRPTDNKQRVQTKQMLPSTRKENKTYKSTVLPQTDASGSTLTLRLLMSYIYIYGAPILDVSRSHTTTQHSR